MKNTNLILGKTCVGKTTGVMFNELKNIIDKRENLIIVDNKEEYFKTYSEELKSNGYNVFVVNYKDASKSNGFNPLLLPYKYYKKGNIDLSLKLIKDFTMELMKNDNAIDPFWGNSASDYLTGLILVLFKEAKEDQINLGSIQMMIVQIEREYDKFKEYVNNLDLMSLEYTYISGTALAPIETRAGIVSVLKTELNKYIAPEKLLNLLCSNELDLIDIKDKVAIFLICDSDYSRLVNIFIDELSVISEVNKISFNYILDNFDSFTKIVTLSDILENSISNGNKIYVISRNIDEIKNRYGNSFVDKFENVINVENENNLLKVGNSKDYPNMKSIKNNYFNFMDKLNNE